MNNKERQSQNEGLIKVNETADKLTELLIKMQSASDDLRDSVNDSLSNKIFGQSFINHVLVDFSQTLLSSKAIILFRNRDEMESFLQEFNNYILSSEDDDYLTYQSSFSILRVSKEIFDSDNKIIYMSSAMVENFEREKPLLELETNIPDDNDLPF